MIMIFKKKRYCIILSKLFHSKKIIEKIMDEMVFLLLKSYFSLRIKCFLDIQRRKVYPFN